MGIEALWRIDQNLYPKLEYKVQYGESDYSFVCRLLEEAGLSFLFQDEDDAGSVLTIDDRPQGRPVRSHRRSASSTTPTSLRRWSS